MTQLKMRYQNIFILFWCEKEIPIYFFSFRFFAVVNCVNATWRNINESRWAFHVVCGLSKRKKQIFTAPQPIGSSFPKQEDQQMCVRHSKSPYSELLLWCIRLCKTQNWLPVQMKCGDLGGVSLKFRILHTIWHRLYVPWESLRCFNKLSDRNTYKFAHSKWHNYLIGLAIANISLSNWIFNLNCVPPYFSPEFFF